MPNELSKLLKEQTCCFSGYRPYKFRFEFEKGNPEYAQMESNIVNAILQSYNEGYRNFLCGGAMGFDLLCGEIALTVKEKFPDMRLICILPFEKQAKNFPKKWSDRYHAVLGKCDIIDYISPEYVAGCYYARNEKMVDLSSRIICFFDGRGGGTARTIAYAQLNKLEIINTCGGTQIPENITFFTGRKRVK